MSFRYYKCKFAKKFFCNATLKQLPNGQKIINRAHNHDVDLNVVKMAEFKKRLETRSATDLIPLTQIYEEEAR